MNPTAEHRKEVFSPFMKSTSETGKKVWKCKKCVINSNYWSNTMEHVENMHVKGVFRYRCLHCSKVSGTYRGRLNHTKKVHYIIDRAKEDDMKFHEDADHTSDFINHENNTSPYIMNPTGKQKSEVFEPYIRTSIKTSKKMWECVVCGKFSQYKCNIMMHVENVHVKGMCRYPCPQCSKVMDSYHGRCIHIKVHT